MNKTALRIAQYGLEWIDVGNKKNPFTNKIYSIFSTILDLKFINSHMLM